MQHRIQVLFLNDVVTNISLKSNNLWKVIFVSSWTLEVSKVTNIHKKEWLSN